jgi:hypothetical protein
MVLHAINSRNNSYKKILKLWTEEILSELSGKALYSEGTWMEYQYVNKLCKKNRAYVNSSGIPFTILFNRFTEAEYH